MPRKKNNNKLLKNKDENLVENNNNKNISLRRSNRSRSSPDRYAETVNVDMIDELEDQEYIIIDDSDDNIYKKNKMDENDDDSEWDMKNDNNDDDDDDDDDDEDFDTDSDFEEFPIALSNEITSQLSKVKEEEEEEELKKEKTQNEKKRNKKKNNKNNNKINNNNNNNNNNIIKKEKKMKLTQSQINFKNSGTMPKDIPEADFNNYSVEISPSSRSACRRCSDKILKNDLRIGIDKGSSQYGQFIQRYHLECSYFPPWVEDITNINGYDHILENDKSELLLERFEKVKGQIDPDLMPIEPEEIARKAWFHKMSEPKELVLPLLPFQKEGLAWMVHQEESILKGGILADEMGMGKTIQAISLILTRKPNKNLPSEEWKNMEFLHEKSDSFQNKDNNNPELFKDKISTKKFGGTLIICPLIAIIQWRSEIMKFAEENCLKIFTYHGPDRRKLLNNIDISTYDIVITTYSTVQSEYANSPDAVIKVKCDICGKKYEPDKLKLHRTYFCGESAKRTEKQSKRQKKRKISNNNNNNSKEKIITISDSDSDNDNNNNNNNNNNNKDEIIELNSDSDSNYSDNNNNNLKKNNKKNNKNKRGRNRNGNKKKNHELSEEELLKIENIINKAIIKAKKNNKVSLLHNINWYRIILDEAHAIKDRRSQTAKSIFSLVSYYKWCLTGTPLQNRVGELFSLLRFLRLDPASYYFCKAKNCNCKRLEYSFGTFRSRCTECNHTPMQHYNYFNHHFMNPIQRDGYIGEGRRALIKLKNEVLDQTLLRRTKNTEVKDLLLPPRVIQVRYCRLDPMENDFYEALYTQSLAKFDTYVSSGTLLHNYAHIFDIIIRLRQALCHPYLVLYSKNRALINDSEFTSISSFNNNNNNNNEINISDDDWISDDSDDFINNENNNVNNNNNNNDNDNDSDSDSDEEEYICGLCHDEIEDKVTSECNHHFCKSCVMDFLNLAISGSDTNCPTCNKPLTIDITKHDDIQKSLMEQAKNNLNLNDNSINNFNNNNNNNNNNNKRRKIDNNNNNNLLKTPKNVKITNKFIKNQKIIHKNSKDFHHTSHYHKKKTIFKNLKIRKHSILERIPIQEFQSSTKLECLMDELNQMKSKDPSAKVIIFSQFVNMIDLIEYRLYLSKWKSVKIIGSMTIQKRDAAIESFKNDFNVNVLLISMKAGGLALNLTRANHIIIFSPWWNPAQELQCVDRCHRIGQFKPIHATRFIIENSIEERILKLQEKKQLVFDGTIGGDAGSLSRLTVDDLRFLFQHG